MSVPIELKTIYAIMLKSMNKCSIRSPDILNFYLGYNRRASRAYVNSRQPTGCDLIKQVNRILDVFIYWQERII